MYSNTNNKAMSTMNATYHIENSPAYLKNGLDFKGDIGLLKNKKSASIIGSRVPTEKGAAAAKMITSLLVQNQFVIISGLALGIDTIAHKQTLEQKGLTIAVLGTPINKVYPKENNDLFNAISERGLVLSQFSIGSTTLRSHFPQRNKTMAYLADMTIVCDASEKSGTKHQVQEALKLNKKVYFLSHLTDSNITWIDKAIQKGAMKIDVSNIKSLLL